MSEQKQEIKQFVVSVDDAGKQLVRRVKEAVPEGHRIVSVSALLAGNGVGVLLVTEPWGVS